MSRDARNLTKPDMPRAARRRRPEPRRGWLKHGNPPGDLSRVARCGARNRRGTPCQCPAMANGRCRLHGGLSTGPKTAEGLARLRRARTTHGRYTKAALEAARVARAQ